MALKTWIDEIKNDDSGKISEAILESINAPADRIKTLEAIADEILFAARDAIIKNGLFYNSLELRAAEDEINQAYKNIISGIGTLTPLHTACERWKAAATQKPEAPVTVQLFKESA